MVTREAGGGEEELKRQGAEGIAGVGRGEGGTYGCTVSRDTRCMTSDRTVARRPWKSQRQATPLLLLPPGRLRAEGGRE
ncbi:hypothetical protein B296_00053989 [Ensete ventricosum]|uniref:Uncharacterized protein n=1 Tax=Ensete ventricosum TaxID=4639 RepID=A0A426XQD1_ENSVE|nr:hypothetical protein B296_00053989 [Ensete ventricosum]